MYIRSKLKAWPRALFNSRKNSISPKKIYFSYPAKTVRLNPLKQNPPDSSEKNRKISRYDYLQNQSSKLAPTASGWKKTGINGKLYPIKSMSSKRKTISLKFKSNTNRQK
jgi:hypothetical protein